MELDLTNIRPQFRNKRLQRNFGFVFDYVDTSALTGQAYLPAMISESTAELHRSSRPEFKREVILASRVSGVEDSFAVAQFTGGMHGDVNFYDNFIDIFNVRFASPLADGGRSFYNYFLVDSGDARGPQDLQNPLPSQASHNPGARRRGQYRLGDLRPCNRRRHACPKGSTSTGSGT